MKIYLIRHAHAIDGEDDAARPLSKQGRKQIKAMASWLRKHELLEAREFWHSPLVRAHDTATRLVKKLRSPAKLREVAGLKPEDNPEKAGRLLRKVTRSVAVVGHEPHLSALASLLVAGRAEPPCFAVQKCAVLAFERQGARWQLLWQVDPELFR